ncbi:DUF443 domain-containing protein [Staphylococcus aureus]|uniref:DUF443 domain-containing protein n=3 Tax=Staphylococcus aureus TaxID=1280 RepID=UPI0021560289|nr:DUF443 domain-containing protein [Staphylococcus aureus]
MLLCDVRVIYKNPKYKVIQHNGEYLLVDLVSTWFVYFFPFINWFIPKKYAIISEEEFENLNIVKTAKINSFWPVAGSTVLFGVMLRRYSHLFIVKYEYSIVILICCIIILGIFLFFLYLNQKLKLQIYNENKNKSNKIIIFPTLKSLCLSIVLYIYLGGGSFFTIYMLLTIEVQNIILFITLFVIFLFFLFLNMCSLYDNKVHVLFKSNGIEKF